MPKSKSAVTLAFILSLVPHIAIASNAQSGAEKGSAILGPVLFYGLLAYGVWKLVWHLIDKKNKETVRKARSKTTPSER